MKYIKFISLFFLIFFFSDIQSQRLNRFTIGTAKDVQLLSKSINELEGIPLKTVSIKRQLAEYYYNIQDYGNAEIYYYEVVSSPDKLNADIYNYASVLLVNEKYYEANYWLNEYAKLEKNDSRAIRYLKEQEYFDELLIDKDQFKVSKLDMNTKYKDYGTSFFKNQIVFTSDRSRIGLKNRSLTRLPLLKLFKAENKRGKLTDIKPFDGLLSKKYRNIHASFNSKGTYMVFTMYDVKNISMSGVKRLNLFFTEITDGKRSEPISCPFNSSEYSVGFASLNSQGDTMYFTSDLPNGYGGTDIYKSAKNENGEWSVPENLGPTINTEGNEMFPVIHESGFLFYASDGLPGIGGLDIFYSKVYDNGYSEPKNFGVPINSSYDDFAFIIDEKMKRGFFTSNRDYGASDDDIYSFNLLKTITLDLTLKGKTKDANGTPISNTNVALYDSENNILRMTESDEAGNFEFKVSQNEIYNLEANKPKYKKDIKTIHTENIEGSIIQNLTLEVLPDFVIVCNVQDKSDHSKLSDVKITYTNKRSNITENDTTNNEGKMFIGLENNQLNDTIDYFLIAEKEGYASKTFDYKEVLKTPGEYKLNVKLQKIEIGEDLGRILEVNPIYFDYDKSEIRPDAAEELDKIIEIMNQFPNMNIELSAHTDCRGSSIYNLKLSDRRAKASANYIKSRISNPSRIYGEGFGETKLINNCSCEGSTRSTCSEEEHQINRRTEFKIIRM